ncbi:beta-ketoacyl-ACP synthase III [Synechococcus sp. NOUM97013]|uniref:beta-ketoacyl-ACP synthase III n=1 Tax=Synechococcus sp. NOUM97013 TaxID=1442555 RepID=UPI0016453EA7|nr:beta-ketoacyl-ACP synthase III [Synechococcus sp. NOUM97013]QNI74667.1 beta-ketoacyl-(acyl-carrier-protein) synthase III (KASIII) [Synechococcus sp. NOUM97013]
MAGASPHSRGVALIGCGSAQAEQVISNDQLGLRVETSDEWIRTRTGIGSRRVSSPKESLTDLAAQAATSALEMAGWSADTLDLVLLATSTPDDLFGSAPRVQAALGARNAVAFDLTAACSGFLFALVTASQYLRTGAMRRVLVIGADQLSRFVDWDDRRSCVLFGDGAGALAIEASEEDGLQGFLLRSDGARGGVLNLPALDTGSPLAGQAEHRQGGYRPIAMNGQEVYKFAVREVPAILQSLLDQCDVGPDEIDWMLLHQANQRILDAVADRFSIPHDKVLSNLAHYGNTSAATIPLVLDEGVRGGRIRPGHLLASSGFGAGLSWGAALLRWQGPA